MNKRFFSAESAHGSESSYGFENDTVVYAFSSKKARDRYVKESSNLSCKAIRFDQVTDCAANVNLITNSDGRPRPFSAEFWGIEDLSFSGRELPEGLIGQVAVCNGREPAGTMVGRLYN